MRTLLLPESYSPHSPTRIAGEDYHYLVRVLRLSTGDSLSGTDRNGGRHLLRITEIEEESLILETIDEEFGARNAENTVSERSDRNIGGSGGAEQDKEGETADQRAGLSAGEGPEIHLFQCLLKGKKMDTVVRQAVETGVRRIVPVSSEHAVARYDEKKKSHKLRRWESIVKEAVQQSGSPVVTEVSEPVSLAEIPSMWWSENKESPDFSMQSGEGTSMREKGKSIDKKHDIGLFFHHTPLEQNVLHRYLSQYLERVALVVGPEGGLSPQEAELLRYSGFTPFFLNTNILRAETAAVYTLGAVQTILTERAFWNPISSVRTKNGEREYTS